MIPQQENQSQAPPSNVSPSPSSTNVSSSPSPTPQQQEQPQEIPSPPRELPPEFVPRYLQQEPTRPLQLAPEFVPRHIQHQQQHQQQHQHQQHHQQQQQYIPVMQHFHHPSRPDGATFQSHPAHQQHPVSLVFQDVQYQQPYMLQPQHPQQQVHNSNVNAQPGCCPARGVATAHVLQAESCHGALNLGSRTAGQQEIKEAYNRLAFEIHRPIKKTAGDAYAYHIIQHAAAILLDPDLRHQYEMTDANRRVPDLLSLYSLNRQRVHEILKRFGLVRVRGIVPHQGTIEFLASGVSSGLNFADFD